jgi:NADH-quinone oxidoreductase subunit G
MADPVKFTIDGHELEAAPGTLVVDAAKRAGIEIPTFCYYEGYSLQAACRMCLVEVEKMPKMQVACTLPVGPGMVIKTNTPQVAAARKSTLEFLLTNHPLDCPVCDKGGECELQDMVFRYGAAESRFIDTKVHVDEQQWSPVVFYDGPRCILCFRCVRVCNEGMGVGALGVINRGVHSLIAPNDGDHLECDECGMCIDICPVGALTSGSYRYKTRPWEMEHVGTICTHCSNGCKTTLGVRNDEIIRGNNRDRSGINGEFLCIKGRYAFDFTHHPERLQTPLINEGGKLEPVSWSKALAHVAKKFQEVKDRDGKFGVIGSTRTSNEENYYLQKFARMGLGTNNIDHHRTGDVAGLLDALAGRTDVLATSDDFYNRKAVLIVGAEVSLEQPFLAFQIRANVRHHGAHVYVVGQKEVREDQIAKRALRVNVGDELRGLDEMRGDLAAEPELVIAFDDGIKGDRVRELVAFGDSLGIPVRYCCLVDYSNSRGAMDMGLTPDLLPGYKALDKPGMTALDMVSAIDLDVLWVVGSNPLEFAKREWRKTFIVVQEMFLTETAKLADVVLPAASGYEKNGTVTNVCGEVQKLKKALNTMGTKSDLEIMGLIGREMGLATMLGPWFPEQVFEEIRANVHGYNVPLPVIATGGAAQAIALNGPIGVAGLATTIESSHDNLFTSGNLGKYSKILNSVLERKANPEGQAQEMEHFNP